MLKKLGWCGLALVLAVGLVNGGLAVAQVTDAQRNQAITDGLVWLALQQNTTIGSPAYGSFGGTYYPVAVTALAVLKFEDHASQIGVDPFSLNYQYSAQVIAGWEYLSTQMTDVSVFQQSAGNPEESNPAPNGQGIVFVSPSPYDGKPTYEMGAVMMALQASEAPDWIFPNSESLIYPDGRTFCEILWECVDWVAWAQMDSGGGRGGWVYTPCNGTGTTSADNSVSQWPVSGLLAAEAWGIYAPHWVKTELQIWLSASGASSDGRFYYQIPTSCLTDCFSTTASGLLGLTYCGVPSTAPRWVLGAGYISTAWGAVGSNLGFLYAMYSLMKTATVAIPVQVLQFGSHSWQAEYDLWLIANQVPQGSVVDPGSWSGGYGNILSTEFALLILQRTAPRRPFCQTGVCGTQEGDVLAYHDQTTVTALGSIRIEECVTRVLELPITKVVGPAVPVALCHDVYSYRVTNIDFHDAIGCGITLFELPNNLGLSLSNVQGHAVNAGGPINWQVGTGSPNIVWTALGNDPDGILPGEYGIFTYTVGCPSTDVQVTGHVNTCSLWPMPEIETAKLGAGYEVNTTGPGGIPNLMIYLNPEIAVTCTCSPSEGFLKCTVTVGVVIKNTGTDAVYTPFDVSMAITDPSNTSNVWAVCTQVFSGPIPFLQGNTHAVFATLSCTFDCHPPVTCLCPPTPAFGVVVTVDSGGVVTESNESDNFAATRGCCQEALPK